MPSYGYGAPTGGYGATTGYGGPQAPAIDYHDEPNIVCKDMYQTQCNTTHEVNKNMSTNQSISKPEMSQNFILILLYKFHLSNASPTSLLFWTIFDSPDDLSQKVLDNYLEKYADPP